jgi:pimeloyl-ACP methyl ester carboxylesterase
VKKLLWSSLALFLLLVLFFVGGGWYFSDQIKAGTIKVNHSKPLADVEVAEISGNHIKLLTMLDIKSRDWQTEGIWGIEWNDGYGQAGEIIDLKDQSVIRKYIPLKGNLNAGDKVRFDEYAFPGNPLQAHDIEFKEVYYSSTIGDFPAWYVEGDIELWTIVVHGHGATRQEALRILPVIKETGLSSFVITYRNDDGVPQNADGFEWFGLTEWEDLEGAVNYALNHGANGVILIGYSMGGGIILEFLHKSPLANRVKGIVLDSPMLDLGACIDHQACQRFLPVVGTPIPGLMIWIAKNLSSIRFGIDFKQLDYLSKVSELDAPILLFHGNADKTVPVKVADAFAKKRGDIVHYIRGPGGHVRNWNVLRSKYEKYLKDFLMEVARQ